jgi:hypothetical protein
MGGDLAYGGRVALFRRKALDETQDLPLSRGHVHSPLPSIFLYTHHLMSCQEKSFAGYPADAAARTPGLARGPGV